MFFEQQKVRTSDWSSDGHIRAETEAIILTGDAERAKALSAYLKDNKLPLDKTIAISEIFDLSGRVIVSSEEKRIGHTKPNAAELEREYAFSSAKNGSFSQTFLSALITEEEGHTATPMIHISVPITSLSTNNAVGVVVNYVTGVMVNHIVGEELNKVMTGEKQIELGALTGGGPIFQSMEMYLVNRDGLMITPSRFVADAVLKQKVFTDATRACLEEEREFSGRYKDYRGVWVYGASMCPQNQHWMLLLEIDEEEVFAPAYQLMRVILGGGFGIIILTSLFGFFWGRRLTTRILSLVTATTEIGLGNFEGRISVAGNDEIAQLETSINGMSVNLQKYTEQTKLFNELKEIKERLLQDKQILDRVLNSAAHGMIAIDKNWNITLWNESMSELSGWTRDEVMGKPFRDFIKLIQEKDRKEYTTFIEDAMIRRGVESLDKQALLITKDGKEVSVSNSADPIHSDNGDVIGVVISIRDIRKELASAGMRSDFAYASHQIRTPITKALWILEACLKKDNIEKIKENVKLAYASLGSIRRLSEELIDVSQIDQSRVISVINTVKLTDFFDDIIKEISKKAEEREIKIIVSPVSTTTIINTDSKLLKRVLIEILGNAIIYSPKKSEIKINVIDNGDGIVIEVQDSGIGISQEHQPLIFTKFFRGSNFDTTEIAGAGLGLYIAREYIKLLDGKIWFKSEENKGTTFYVSISVLVKQL